MTLADGGDLRSNRHHSPTRTLTAFSVCSIVCVWACLWGAYAHASDLSAREVISRIFQAEPDQPVDFADLDLSFLNLADVDFKKANLVGADLFGCDLTGADLSGTDLSETRLDRATIIRTDFSNANLEGASLLRPSGFTSMAFDVREVANFTGARMKDVRFLGRLDGTSFRKADLTNANFAPVKLRSDTIASILVTQLNRADFTEATIVGANFRRAHLSFAIFKNSDLKNTSFKETDLTNADFSGADVTNVDFTDAKLNGANFRNTIGLDKTKGLPGRHKAELATNPQQ